MGHSTLSVIGEVFAHHAEREAKAIALLCEGVEPLTFGALDRHIRLIGERLLAAGVGPSSRVAVALPRSPEAALVSLAVCAVATMLPINPTLSETELATELSLLRPDLLIVAGGAELQPWAARAKEGCAVFQVSRIVSSFDEIALEQHSPSRRPQPSSALHGASVAVVFRTSGTTGIPKRVPVTHENLIEMARKMERWLGLTPADRSACILPIYYNAGFKATLLVPLLVGCSVVMPASTNPQELDLWLSESRPTWLTAAPSFLIAVLDKLRTLPADELRHSLRFVLSTASYLPETVRRELEARLGVPVREFYGLAEAGMMTAPALRGECRPGTVGRVPEVELAIRDGDGVMLPAGQVGPIRVRGPSVTPGYLDDIDGAPNGLQDGWLETGDLGSIDGDGFLTVVGRTKEIINRGGEKISPYEVEKELLMHPSVREAAVFGVPHPRLGENVAAAVTLKPGSEATSSQLLAFLHDRLAPFQMPRHVSVLPNLPLGVTGKISRPRLAAARVNQARRPEPPVEPLHILIAELWERLLQRADLGVDDDFFEVGGDSLLATEMLLELQQTTGRTVSMADIRGELSIRQLAQSLVRDVDTEAELVTRIRDGKGTALFLFHGDFTGLGLYALRLVELLDDDAPVFLVHSCLDRNAGVATIEDMVRLYLPRLLAAWPEGDFRLAGYCHGGLAAWEVAHELETAGRTVSRVMLIDTFSLNARRPMRLLANAMKIVGAIVPGSLGELCRHSVMPTIWVLARRVLNRDGAIVQRVMRRFRNRHFMSHVPGSAATPYTNYFGAMSQYVPPRIGANIVCLLSEDTATKEEYAAGPWAKLAHSNHHERISGNHTTCITRHVGELAATINAALAVPAGGNIARQTAQST